MDPLLERLDLMQVAKAALRCNMESTALLHLELWEEATSRRRGAGAAQPSHIGSFADLFVKSEFDKVLFEAYRRMGSPDALRGVGLHTTLGDLVDVDLLNENWGDALAGIDGLLHTSRGDGAGSGRDLHGELHSTLRRTGLNHLYDFYINAKSGAAQMDGHLADGEVGLAGGVACDFEVGWRFLRPVSQHNLAFRRSESFDYVLYQGVASLTDGDESRFKHVCDLGRRIVAKELRTALVTRESAAHIHEQLRRMQHLHELEALRAIRWRSPNGESPVSIANMVNTKVGRGWDADMAMRGLSFDEGEPLLALRSSMLRAIDLSFAGGGGASHEAQASATPLTRNGTDRSERGGRSRGLRRASHVPLAQSSGSEAIGHALNSHLVFQAKFARENGRPDLARNYIHEVDSAGLSEDLEKLTEHASVLWSNAQPESAVAVLSRVRGALEGSRDPAKQLLLATALLRAGSWLAESSAESSETILEKYYDRASQLSGELAHCRPHAARLLAECRTTKAKYLDKLFCSVAAREQSPEWRRVVAFQEQREKSLRELKELERAGSSRSGADATKSEKRRKATQSKHEKARERERKGLLFKVQQQIKADKARRAEMAATHARLLNGAITAYADALRCSGDIPVSFAFRFVSLWFEHETNPAVNDLVGQLVGAARHENGSGVPSSPGIGHLVPSVKLLPLIYQIASRLGSPVDADTGFNHAVTAVLELLAREHPFHVVPHLFAMANAEWLASDPSQVGDFLTTNRAKKLVAEQLLSKLKADPGNPNREDVAAVELLLRALTALAYEPSVKQRLGKPIQLNSAGQFWTHLLAYKAMKRPVPVPVCEVQPRATGDYRADRDALDLVEGFGETYVESKAGRSHPKILKVTTSRGKVVRMLAKADDDLRQDAVMQQLFGLVHQLLAHDPRTARSKLGIRTYKVVPLTPKAGVIRWVENSMAIFSYLCETSNRGLAPAHERYRRQNEMSHADCSRTMMAVRDANHGEPKEAKRFDKQLKAFREVCEKTSPVMHHFFLEHYSSPAEWHARRTSYTRSVAVNSIVGYIMGIGDRHLLNVLIDRESAEVVHIDFGITFEQGRCLPTPELVPFRLTRDMVDGMGVTGTNGIFRSGCEDTLAVLRDNTESLMAICKVFLHDPLYSWTVSHEKAVRGQDIEENGDSSTQHSMRSTSAGSVISAVSSRDRASRLGRASSAGGTSVDQDGAFGLARTGSGAPQSLEADAEARTSGPQQANMEAESALLRVQEKLQGREGTGGETLTVPGQVRRLVNEARDEALLCQMYPGWAAWL